MSWLSDIGHKIGQAIGSEDKPKSNSGPPSSTQPTSAEEQLRQAQIGLLNTQTEDWKKLKPLLIQNMGFKLDDKGNYVAMTEAERYASMTGEQQRQYDLNKHVADYESKALAGKLPVSPALEAQLNTREEGIKQDLASRLGDNYMLTTAGQTGIAHMNEASDLVREEARRGMLTTTSGILNMGTNTGLNLAQTGYKNINEFGSSVLPMVSGYSTAMQPFMQDRTNLLAWQMQQEANKQQSSSDFMRLFGMGTGGILSNPGFFSWLGGGGAAAGGAAAGGIAEAGAIAPLLIV